MHDIIYYELSGIRWIFVVFVVMIIKELVRYLRVGIRVWLVVQARQTIDRAFQHIYGVFRFCFRADRSKGRIFQTTMPTFQDFLSLLCAIVLLMVLRLKGTSRSAMCLKIRYAALLFSIRACLLCIPASHLFFVTFWRSFYWRDYQRGTLGVHQKSRITKMPQRYETWKHFDIIRAGPYIFPLLYLHS